ncbi:hypothetical protein QUA82_34130 [Microcoleus sp. F8-D3]
MGKIEREQTTRLNQKTLRGLAYALEIPAAYLEAVTKGIPLSVTTSVKFCPICWIPGTAPESMWTDARAKFCFACGTALRQSVSQLLATCGFFKISLLSVLWEFF